MNNKQSKIHGKYVKIIIEDFVKNVDKGFFISLSNKSTNINPQYKENFSLLNQSAGTEQPEHLLATPHTTQWTVILPFRPALPSITAQLLDVTFSLTGRFKYIYVYIYIL